jgi:hypothetical protein
MDNYINELYIYIEREGERETEHPLCKYIKQIRIRRFDQLYASIISIIHEP